MTEFRREVPMNAAGDKAAVEAEFKTGDIEIGAVEIKDGATDQRATVEINGGLKTTSADKDDNGNLPVTLGDALDKENDSIKIYPVAPIPVPLSASGIILTDPGQIVGFYVNSTAAGTIRFGAQNTAGGSYLGAAITPAVGWNEFHARLANGGYATIANVLDVTIMVIPD